MARIIRNRWFNYLIFRLQDTISDFKSALGPHATPLLTMVQVLFWTAWATCNSYMFLQSTLHRNLAWLGVFLIIMVASMNLYFRGQRVGHRQVFAKWKEHNDEWRRELSKAFRESNRKAD